MRSFGTYIPFAAVSPGTVSGKRGMLGFGARESDGLVGEHALFFLTFRYPSPS